MELFATALPALADAWALILQPVVLGYLVLGVVMGLAVGVFPGLGGIAGLSLLLPFMFGMEPVYGLALMIGMVAVVPTSDTFSSVLMGIPGSSASQATVLDGFPLARKGQAARALSAAFTASLFGGLVGACFLTLFIVVARPLVLAFGLPEMLMISILGLSMVAVLAGRVALKGLAAAGLGMLIGTIGVADAGGSLRMASYDFPYLMDGLQLVIVGLGIFAVPEIVSLLRQDRSISKDASLGAGWMDGVRDWIDNKWLSVRCSLIGVLVGVIPGLGGSVVDWIAYGHAVQTTKDKSNFGKGEIRGVIGPESSNNAKEGGGLVPTLLFGIPGSGSMAIFIGAIALLGSGDIEVGPSMLRDNLDITYSIVWLLALANVVGTLLCIGISGGIARLTTIRFTYLAPFLFMLISFAAFQSGQNFEDILALFAIGLIGIFLRRFDWSRPAFLIGFVLSDPVEKFSNQAYQIASFRFRQSFEEGLSYIFSPIVIVLLVVTVVSVVMGLRQAKTIMAEGDVQSGSKRAPVVFLLVITAYVVTALINASLIPNFNMTDKIVPLVIGGVTLAALLVLLVQMILRNESDAIFSDKESAGEDADAPYGLWSTLAWFVGLIAATYVLGFILALFGFLVTFLRVRAQAPWPKTLILTACGIALMCVMAGSLNRDFPPGLLQDAVDLPWPLK
ncbi:tripartite tricarboxylate transporter permease [Sulfitobacter pseudonitzschiae]|jgi:putative tricarboxylic transport membrane protein|uniref:Tripartite tricarboxylate transporter permease n=1 Tax=Pseudosulfitobacter pseudonitzschiae TaxID=1402135 RepID=A0A9Q2NYL5_9RHOB|nr:tripartite tricarboxylate transporter permease [Pseudosulfitobacter pseudonitzschiae]MBM2294946.1 tripartite tricarboxylate transporter permease [Pseudosulfitobacter pseudonitzschiae]MBM2299862.1 tripartite tricarboxylate transporter permease [Pseudosulfitobacter pseudonitzschiae]MBM2304783.1 tripartite tricarboxylate transporter permease [Pseudosulfitobacter pseudonitzschiae]MBM2314557.1 tripartite tricarboxylate transporter permease [Pseudosulfitobacter pseudonitzschiae]MBM2319467.1 tripa|tara:strand:+ start:2908 stop:4938 length:2031 start_codon:yes stop_codon:yes gene_type:complete